MNTEETVMWTKKAILFYAERYGYDAALELMYVIEPECFVGTATHYYMLFDDIMSVVFDLDRY